MVGHHQIIEAHEQYSVAGKSLEFPRYIYQICPDCPVLDEVAELEQVGILCIEGQQFAVLYALVVVNYDIHARDNVLVLAKMIVVNYLDEGHFNHLPTVCFAV